MKIPAIFLIFCLMGLGEAMEDYIGDKSTLVDIALEDVPVKKCDSIIVSWSPLQNVGRSTVFFTNIDDLNVFLEDRDDFEHTLSNMECLILGSNPVMKSPKGHIFLAGSSNLLRLQKKSTSIHTCWFPICMVTWWLIVEQLPGCQVWQLCLYGGSDWLCWTVAWKSAKKQKEALSLHCPDNWPWSLEKQVLQLQCSCHKSIRRRFSFYWFLSFILWLPISLITHRQCASDHISLPCFRV